MEVKQETVKQETMKVLHVIGSVDPRCGGPSHVIRNVVREQVRMGYPVSLLATTVQALGREEPRDAYKRRMLADPDFSGAEVYLGNAFGRRPPWSSYAFSPQCSRWLRQMLSDRLRLPDVIHIHGVFAHAMSVAAALARRRSIPYLIEPYGCLDSTSFRMGSRWLKKIFARLVLQKDLHRAACVHPASQHEAEELRRWVPDERIKVIPHGIDVPQFDPADATRQFLSRFPRVRDRRIILCMSRIHPIKRIDLLVEALALLHPKHPELALLIVGKDSGHEAAVRAAVGRLGLEDSVVFTGFLQGELKHGAFAVADLFGLTSKHENFGIAVVEAMAYGVPVLVTPEVASHVYVDQSGGGITTEGNARAIADGIKKLLGDSAKDMGQQGRQFVEKNLSWPSVIKQLDALYQEIIT